MTVAAAARKPEVVVVVEPELLITQTPAEMAFTMALLILVETPVQAELPEVVREELGVGTIPVTPARLSPEREHREPKAVAALLYGGPGAAVVVVVGEEPLFRAFPVQVAEAEVL